MTRLLPALALGFIVGCGGARHDGHSDHGKDAVNGNDGHTHGEAHKGYGGGANSTLHVATGSGSPSARQPVTLKLMIHDAGGTMLKDFAVVHEQKVHLIVVREGLDHFAHLHPEVDAKGNMKVDYTFPTGGKYLLFADYQPVGKAGEVARAEVRVEGDAPTAPPLVPNVPGRVPGDGIVADVTVENGRDATVRFRVKDETDKAVDLEPYMGARGHLVVLSEGGKDYVHAHPEEGGKAQPDTVAFGVHFPGPGLYKGWGQFKRGGKVHTVPFVVKVE